MKQINIISILSLMAIFVCCANAPQQKTTEVAQDNPAPVVDAKSIENTPTDVKCFGLLGNVKEVLLSIREYTEGSENDFWESKDSLELAFDENGRIVRDSYENIYKYDDKGNFIQGLSDKSKMRRDDKARVVFYENRMDEEDDQGFSMTFEYDGNDRMTKVVYTGWEFTVDHLFTYTDSNVYPDRINMEAEDEGDHYSTVITYTYKKFDDHGNWTEREAHSVAKHTIDDEPEGDDTILKRIEQRKISYYQQ